jgi:cell division protein FtsW
MSFGVALKPLIAEHWQPDLLAQLRPDLLRLLSSRLVFIWATLMTFGLVLVASSSIGFADSVYGDEWYFARRHVIFLCMGLALCTAVALIPLSVWQRYAWVLLVVAFLLLALVLVPGIGRRVNGSQRWLILGPLTLQASEVVKFCVIVFFAAYFTKRAAELSLHNKGLLRALSILAVFIVLLLLEPDFGSSVVIVATVMGMLFFVGLRLWVMLTLMGLGGGLFVVMALMSPYRLQRLVTYLDPWADQFNAGYQLTQSLIAFGNGQWFGQGLGNSIQKMLYLPEAHTDFVFAVVAEELGLLGGLVVIFAFSFLIFELLRRCRSRMAHNDCFAALLMFGIAILFAVQAFINVGVASGFLPTKGLTLPFISYGGSSLMLCCALMGLVLRVDWESEVQVVRSTVTTAKRRATKVVAKPGRKVLEAGDD